MTKIRRGRVWFWKPSWYWYGWRTLIPFVYGHDEYARRTIMIGWTVTGRVIIAVWGCGDPECERIALEFIADGEYSAYEKGGKYYDET